MANFIMSGTSMVLVFSDTGESFTINKEDDLFGLVATYLNEGKTEEEIRKLIVGNNQTTEEYIKKQKKKNVRFEDGEVLINDKIIHNSITKRIKEFKRENLPIDNLLKFLAKIEKNPSFNSKEQLYNFLEHKNLPITDDGNFLAYKAVKEDYTDKHTGKIDNSIGQTVKMKRELIDDDPGTACGKGLHAGSLEYVSKFSSDYNCDKIVIVKINPKNAVSVPKCSSFQKIRVCKYKVLRDFEGTMEVPLYDEEGNPSKEVVNRERIEYNGDWECSDEYEVEEVESYSDVDTENRHEGCDIVNTDGYEDDWDEDNSDYYDYDEEETCEGCGQHEDSFGCGCHEEQSDSIKDEDSYICGTYVNPNEIQPEQNLDYPREIEL